MKRLRQIVLIAFLLPALWMLVAETAAAQTGGTAAPAATENPSSGAADTQRDAAAALLASMSVEERVGQLFLVTFRGDSAPPGSDIADLILNYRVGGVALRADHDNITGYGDLEQAPTQVLSLTNSLQALALQGAPLSDNVPEAEATISSATPSSPRSTISIPLLIATNHEGMGAAFTEIRHGVTAVPNNMTIGATWNPAYANAIGEIVGRELSALGVNMLLGPALDVLESPAPNNPADMGVRSFGGDPYWVGQMGQAYTAGVHQGSNGRIAVIAKHFPGNGSSDRPVYEEVSTVRKSLEQLKQIELAPFFAVTGPITLTAARVDGLLTTHIRYQGFQGNIRATTVPVSFDPQALMTLMDLAPFNQWRADGGVIVSDALGVRSVERFYDDTEQTFPHRRVAKDAFLAGNDLLYLADFALGSGNAAVELANIKDTIVWFQEKYRTDPSFQQRVDEAVLRILQLKLRLYDGDFGAQSVQHTAVLNRVLGQETAVVTDLIQDALTLISPSPAELAERIATPPGPDDDIIIFSDVQQRQQCTTCPPEPIIAESALRERILTLYGPNATGQVRPGQVQAFSFTDLNAFLTANPDLTAQPVPATVAPTPEPGLQVPEDPPPTPAPTPTLEPSLQVQNALQGAEWIIFAMQEATAAGGALKTFLAQRPDIVRNARVIVFAYGPPYYLDTTEISKLTAYYGAYTPINAAIDAAARALFLELPLDGNLPVNVPGIGYDLFRQTQPDPDQVISLFIIGQNELVQSPPSEEPLNFSVGDTLRLRTGVIYDRNGHPVPDGTVVEFVQLDRVQGLVNILAEKPTQDGVAEVDYVLEARTGQFRITARSGEATQSQEVDILIEEEAQVTIIMPTPAPTPTPTPMPTSTPTPTPTTTPSPTASVTPTIVPPTPQEPALRIALSEATTLLTLFMGLGVVSAAGVWFSRRFQMPLENQVGWPLWGVCGGLLVYLYVGLELPGTAVWANLGSWVGLLTTLLGGCLGLGLYAWYHR